MSVPKKKNVVEPMIQSTSNAPQIPSTNTTIPRIYEPSPAPPHVPRISSEAKLLHHTAHVHAISTGSFLPPIMVDIDPVDGVCNLDCNWCCQAKSRSARPAKFMTPNTMKQLGVFCGDWGVKSWRISGDSEPLLNQNIDTLIHSGYDSGIDIGLITNGVFLERVSAFSKLTYLGVSLDATTASTWSQVKNTSPRGFDTIINNIKRIRNDHPSLDLCIKFVRFDAKKSLNKHQFSEHLSIISETDVAEVDNYVEAEEMEDFAKILAAEQLYEMHILKILLRRISFLSVMSHQWEEFLTLLTTFICAVMPEVSTSSRMTTLATTGRNSLDFGVLICTRN